MQGPVAVVGGMLATDLLDVTDDVAALDSRGFWVVVGAFEGSFTCARFASVRPLPSARRSCHTPSLPSGPGGAAFGPDVGAPGDGADDGGPSGRSRYTPSLPSHPGGAAFGPDVGAPWQPVGGWASSLSYPEWAAGVDYIREAIAAGDVYQVNLTRRLSAPCSATSLHPLFARFAEAPHAAYVSLPGVEVASASPERFLRRDGRTVQSQPIKGTAASGADFLDKDRAENVMIVDLVRNDLGRVCEFGSISVPALCAVETQPGLSHLVSTVQGELRPQTTWGDLLHAAFPAGSVTGAPKLAALDVIAKLEPVPRDIYCGTVGWVDADRGQGDLNVAIRTFWLAGGRLHFGTGGGITWDSTPDGEWRETEVKAAHLLSLAS